MERPQIIVANKMEGAWESRKLLKNSRKSAANYDEF